jgi:hypothetical protein
MSSGGQRSNEHRRQLGFAPLLLLLLPHVLLLPFNRLPLLPVCLQPHLPLRLLLLDLPLRLSLRLTAPQRDIALAPLHAPCTLPRIRAVARRSGIDAAVVAVRNDGAIVHTQTTVAEAEALVRLPAMRIDTDLARAHHTALTLHIALAHAPVHIGATIESTIENATAPAKYDRTDPDRDRETDLREETDDDARIWRRRALQLPKFEIVSRSFASLNSKSNGKHKSVPRHGLNFITAVTVDLELDVKILGIYSSTMLEPARALAISLPVAAGKRTACGGAGLADFSFRIRS